MATEKPAGESLPQSNCCETNLANAPGTSAGIAQEGQQWTCPSCGKIWEHICDEAEGCSWETVGQLEPEPPVAPLSPQKCAECGEGYGYFVHHNPKLTFHHQFKPVAPLSAGEPQQITALRDLVKLLRYQHPYNESYAFAQAKWAIEAYEKEPSSALPASPPDLDELKQAWRKPEAEPPLEQLAREIVSMIPPFVSTSEAFEDRCMWVRGKLRHLLAQQGKEQV